MKRSAALDAWQQAPRVVDRAASAADMRSEVLAGLTNEPKQIAPKYFYDARGSALFERITELPEYYPTRTELGILRAHRAEIASVVGADKVMIEFGSGSSEKIRLLLDALRPRIYLPVDISAEHLEAAAGALQGDYDWLSILPVSADYTRPFEIPDGASEGKRLVFFPGSSVGNFEPDDAVEFLGNVARLIGNDGQLLIGVDLKKDRAVLERAYDDESGVTAQFNLNVLQHLNSRLAGNFDLAAFSHRAHYNSQRGRIEMHLISRFDQVVDIAGRRVHLRRGEAIHTENSYKYHPEEFDQMARSAGLRLKRRWMDARGWFAVVLYDRTAD
jgi:dimethylhistidine N-methyltransferase